MTPVIFFPGRRSKELRANMHTAQTTSTTQTGFFSFLFFSPPSLFLYYFFDVVVNFWMSVMRWIFSEFRVRSRDQPTSDQTFNQINRDKVFFFFTSYMRRRSCCFFSRCVAQLKMSLRLFSKVFGCCCWAELQFNWSRAGVLRQTVSLSSKWPRPLPTDARSTWFYQHTARLASTSMGSLKYLKGTRRIPGIEWERENSRNYSGPSN